MTLAENAANVSPIAFDNSYARLPERFYARLSPTPVAAPRLIRVNHALAGTLGFDPAANHAVAGPAQAAAGAIRHDPSADSVVRAAAGSIETKALIALSPPTTTSSSSAWITSWNDGRLIRLLPRRITSTLIVCER